MSPGGADSALERVPELVEVAVSRLDRERAVGDVVQPRLSPERGELSLVPAEALRFVATGDAGLANGLPVPAEHRHPAGHVPDAGGQQPTGPGHAGHLADRCRRVLHEVEDELREGAVEGAVLEGKGLGRRDADVGSRDARSAFLDERLRRVDGRHLVGADEFGEDGGEGAGAAADVQHVLPRATPAARANSGASERLYRPMNVS